MRATIPIAETFYSIQGEGPSAGVPAVFLRTSYCNLRCPGWGPPGDQHGCDTGLVWRRVWREMTPEEVMAWWQAEGWLPRLVDGGAHLVVTGGEPLLWQNVLAPLLRLLAPLQPCIEVETNGTLQPQPAFDYHIRQYNCSPKLASAGNPLQRAYHPEVLRRFVSDHRAVFKFVVQDAEADLAEIEQRYVGELDIAPSRIWLMPEAGDRRSLIARSAEIMELARDHGYRFTSRLHLIAWDQATGV